MGLIVFFFFLACIKTILYYYSLYPLYDDYEKILILYKRKEKGEKLERFFNHTQPIRTAKEYMEDKTYSPMAYMVLREFSMQKNSIADNRNIITPQEKNHVLCGTLGYSRSKASSVVESLERHGEISVDGNGNIIMKEFDYKKSHIKLNKETCQFLYDTFGKDTLAVKVYAYLGLCWNIQHNLNEFPNGYKFTIGGNGKMSLLKKMGYKTTTPELKEKVLAIFKILTENGLLNVSEPHMVKFNNFRMGYVRTLYYWSLLDEETEQTFTPIPPQGYESKKVNTKRFTYDIHRLRPYYMDENDPRYGFMEDVGRLGSNAVLVLYEDVDDDSLIKLLDEYPQEMDMPVGRIMYSTLEPMDDDYDVI